MFKKCMSLIFVGLLLNLTIYSTATANTEKDAEFAKKVKANIVILGVGIDAKVEVKLKEGTKLKGYVSEVKESGFVLINEKTGTSKEISYSQVKQAKGINSKTGHCIFTTVLVVGLLVLLSWGGIRGN